MIWTCSTVVFFVKSCHNAHRGKLKSWQIRLGAENSADFIRPLNSQQSIKGNNISHFFPTCKPQKNRYLYKYWKYPCSWIFRSLVTHHQLLNNRLGRRISLSHLIQLLNQSVRLGLCWHGDAELPKKNHKSLTPQQLPARFPCVFSERGVSGHAGGHAPISPSFDRNSASPGISPCSHLFPCERSGAPAHLAPRLLSLAAEQTEWACGPCCLMGLGPASSLTPYYTDSTRRP